MTFVSGLSFSHDGHTYNKVNEIAKISNFKINLITETKQIDYSLENNRCVLASISMCNCCCDGVCFGFDYKCEQYNNNAKKHSCMYQCSPNESNGTPLVNSDPSQKIWLNPDVNNSDKINSELKIFTILPTENLFKVSTPTYITVRAILI